MIGRMEPTHDARMRETDALIRETRIFCEDAAAARAELAIARARFAATQDVMHRALLEVEWPIRVPSGRKRVDAG